LNLPLFIGMSQWTEQYLDDLMPTLDRKLGIILGDPFCSERMFRFGNLDIATFADKAVRNGLQVAYQTPVYLTSRSYNETLRMIMLLNERDCLHLLLLQDIGLLAQLKREGFNVPICWSYWGTKRSDLLSRDFLDMLLESGVTYLETVKPKRIGLMQEYGFKVVYRLYSPSVVSFGRVCYNRYFNNEIKETEPPRCLSNVRMVTGDGKLKYLVQGYQITYQKPMAKPLPNGQIPEYTSVHVRDQKELTNILDKYGL
jgi:hypothetical protein